MRVLMVNHPDCQAFRGGDLVQMEHTAAALQKLGVAVEFSFDLDPSAAGFDVAHVFNVRTIGATPQQVAHLKRQGVPVVLSPIYLNPSFGLWGTRVVTGIFQSQPSPDNLPSWSEPCGLVNLEAALAGCSLVAGMAGYEMESLRDGADYCDPADVTSIRDAVLRPWHNHAQTAERRLRLKARALSEFTWERAAETTLRSTHEC